MGYYVKTTKVDFRIPAAKIPDAFHILKKLNGPEFDHLKTVGSWSGGKQIAKWYAWMPADYHLTCKSVKEIFEELGFQDCVEDGLGFKLGSYDNKAGAESVFLQAVAKFAQDGVIDWTGEDGSMWRNRFDDGVMTTIDMGHDSSYDYDEDEEDEDA
jgi:hypothetical protein